MWMTWSIDEVSIVYTAQLVFQFLQSELMCEAVLYRIAQSAK